MTVQEKQPDTPRKEDTAMKPAGNSNTGRSSRKGKRGQLLQETGVRFLSEPGSEKEKIERLLDGEK
jgi:hypothetical protein